MPDAGGARSKHQKIEQHEKRDKKREKMKLEIYFP